MPVPVHAIMLDPLGRYIISLGVLCTVLMIGYAITPNSSTKCTLKIILLAGSYIAILAVSAHVILTQLLPSAASSSDIPVEICFILIELGMIGTFAISGISKAMKYMY